MSIVLSKTTIHQLNDWARCDENIENDVVKNSDFYHAIQTATSLTVYKADLTQKGLLLLANIVAKSTSLTALSMRDCGIGSNASAFGEALAKSTSLTVLGMHNNNISDSIVAFGAAIAKSTSLTVLNIGGNDIGANAVAFGAAISQSTSLTELYMWNNNIDNDTLSTFIKKLACDSNLTVLIGYSNFKDHVGYQEKFYNVLSPKKMVEIKVRLEPIFPNDIAGIVTDYIGYPEINVISIDVSNGGDCCCVIL